MIVSIDAFILVLSPAASVFAAAIFVYESVMTDSNCGSCSAVSFRVVFHLASASLAISSGDFMVADLWAAGLAVLSMAAPWAKAVDANATRTSAIKLNRANFMAYLPDV